MTTNKSVKGGKYNKKGGLSLTKGLSDLKILGDKIKEKGSEITKKVRRKLPGNKNVDTPVDTASVNTDLASHPGITPPTSVGTTSVGGRRSRRHYRRRSRGGSSNTGGGTYKDITNGAEGPTPLQAVDYNNNGDDSGTPWGGSNKKPWGNAWNSWFIGPNSPGPRSSWGSPINLNNVKFSIGGGRTHPKKGQKSRTMRKKKDFTTKKGNTRFNRRGHRQKHAQGSKKKRAPYKKITAKYIHPKKGQKSRTIKNEEDFTTKEFRSKWFNRHKQRQNHAQGSKKIRLPYMTGGGCGCQKSSSNPQSMNLIEE